MVHSQVQVPPELEGKRRSEQYSSSEYASDTDGEPGGDHIHLLKEYDSSLEMMAMGGMWMCGILNNFGYVILNTAAETIFPGKAGLVLFFNIVPGLLVKMAVPFFAHLLSYRAKVILVTFGALISMLIVAGTDVPELKCLGIAMMSMSSCFGEVCFLAMSFNFPDKSITYWSSGTGVSGVFGSA